MNALSPQSELQAKLPFIEPLLNASAVFILATIFLSWDASRAVYVISALAAMVILLKYRPRMPRDHRLYTWPIIGYVGTAFLSVLFNDMTDSGINKLISRYFLLLLAIPLAGLFYLSFDSRRNVWIKFIVGCAVMGILALVDLTSLSKTRAEGSHNAAAFGFIALAMTSIVIASYRKFCKLRFGRSVYAAAVLLGVCAILLSGTRTAVLAGFAVLVVALFFYLDRVSLIKRWLIVLALVAVTVIVSGSIPVVQNRFGTMVELSMPYLKGEGQMAPNGISKRIETWKGAWHMGLDNPLFGFGPGNTKKALRNYVKQNQHLKPLEKMTHIHNQFMQSFAMTGLIGLLSLLALIGCHLWLFGRYLRSRYSTEVRGLALAGVLLLVAYVIKSLPGVPFYGKYYLLMYGISSAAIWGSLLGALRAAQYQVPGEKDLSLSRPE